jgi:hypothetical protein
MKLKLMAGAIGLALALGAGAAKADVLFDLVGPTPEMPSPDSLGVAFNAGSGAGSTTFRIDGYTSLDGDSDCCTDVFTLNLNGVDIFSGSWDMGGGGGNVIYFGPVGATAVGHSNGFFAGGFTDVFVPLNLVAGTNTLTFSYSGAFQGLGDEGWGLENVVVNGNAAGVPEPAAWALMLLGFAGLGGLLRHRRALAAA